MDVFRGVIFAILMQNGDGIMDKSPDYIDEKLDACERDPQPELLLDEHNRRILENWLSFWRRKVIEAHGGMLEGPPHED